MADNISHDNRKQTWSYSDNTLKSFKSEIQNLFYLVVTPLASRGAATPFEVLWSFSLCRIKSVSGQKVLILASEIKVTWPEEQFKPFIYFFSYILFRDLRYFFNTDAKLTLFTWSSRAEVFNRGSAAPRGSAEVLQGVREILMGWWQFFFFFFNQSVFPRNFMSSEPELYLLSLNMSAVNRLKKLIKLITSIGCD